MRLEGEGLTPLHRRRAQQQSPPKGTDAGEYERTLQMEEHSAITQYGIEQLQALQKLCRELEKKVLQLKVRHYRCPCQRSPLS